MKVQTKSEGKLSQLNVVMTKKVSFESAMKAKYKEKYGTSKLGYRRCLKRLSKECLKLAPREQFKGLFCNACLKVKQHQFYEKRLDRASKKVK